MSFLSSVFIAVVYASATLATPFPAASKYSTHRVRELSSGLKVETFNPESTYKTFGSGIDHSGSGSSLQDATIAFVKEQTGVQEVAFKTGYTAETAKVAYVRQTHNGIPFANAVANVAFNNADKVVAFGSSFVKPTSFASSTPTIKDADAIAKAESALGGKHNDSPVTIQYLARHDNTAALVFAVQIQNEDEGSWYEAFIDANSGALLSVNDFVADASYQVLPISKEYPTDGFETLTDPQDTTASPNGWHTANTAETAGNNVVTYKGIFQGQTTKQSSDGLNFIYPQDPASEPTTSGNIDAARTNAFYIVNKIHDISYKYGFTEAAFNFQNDNFGKGGSGNDRVRVSVQDFSGKDNANFATPPDGQSGQMRMYLWDLTKPGRDGALENDIVAHENTHGISNRLTGGGTGSCLQSTEAGGMGEGWSDSFADWTEQKSAPIADYALGEYVINKPGGIRTHPYSSSATTNPLRYSSVAKLNEVHNIGEVWANMLHNVHADLVAAHGFSKTAQTDPTGSEGNVVWLHLFIDSLALQPCTPKFTSSRDAWIQADANRYNGANKCLLWKSFASRGLGVNAANFVDDSSVPADCTSA